MHLLTRASILLLILASVAGCGTSEEAPAQAYLDLAASYNAVLAETNAQLGGAQISGAFARLAVAEHAFGAGLEATKFPPNAAEPAMRLRSASLTLEHLYGAQLRPTAQPSQSELLDEIAAARASSSQAAADLRRALGLPVSAAP